MAAKYQEIAELIRGRILSGYFGERTLLPTEQEFCQEFQVSRQTVRQALSVLVNQGLIEKRQGSGSHIRDLSQPALPPQRSIAVVTTYIGDYIFPSILREIETVLAANNSAPVLFATQNQVANERRILQRLITQPLDGILVEGTKTALPNPNLDLYRKLIAKGMPLLFMHCNYPELTGTLSVLDDNYGGGHQLVEYLYRKGHRRIAGIFKNDDIQGHQRYAGYAAALREYDLPMEDGQIFWYGTEFKERLLAGGSTEELEAVLTDCTAVVCYNDEIANRLVTQLAKRGVKMPEEMAVVSFDNSQYSEMAPLRITSLSHGPYNVGRMSAELLFRWMEGQSCQPMVSPWVLVEKETS